MRTSKSLPTTVTLFLGGTNGHQKERERNKQQTNTKANEPSGKQVAHQQPNQPTDILV